jgi:hypothetical protein
MMIVTLMMVSFMFLSPPLAVLDPRPMQCISMHRAVSCTQVLGSRRDCPSCEGCRSVEPELPPHRHILKSHDHHHYSYPTPSPPIAQMELPD